MTLGARFYSNEPVPNYVQGFLDGDIAEVLLFDRALPAAEADQVSSYLRAKHEGLTQALASDRAGRPLKTVENPPPVQFLRPGFSTRELPVRLTNINNVRYRPDGTLVALAYNGDILLLRDRDGDGLEEEVQTFFIGRGQLRSAIGMALSLPGDPRGQGVYVASKGKISFVVDDDGDDRADREVVLATGWEESGHGVDALGITVDRQGAVYYGLGTASFTEAYLLDKQGKSHYDLASERGSIVRIDPKTGERTVYCTGIRFPVALAFDHRGDLFCTDQEGATWLPNGNPFDELLHIQPGRHYGFPPRHPKHLPNVIDEPSVFDYKPQHQSTCGLVFNNPVRAGGPTFGPADWAGDALVCGYSRGKLYRTRLVPTASGYVATSELLAVLQKLTVDACVAPDGSLLVATHSGQPDWGSGPDGQGTLYKVTYRDRPQPLAAWMASPREIQVAFDQPLGPEDQQALRQGSALVRGSSVTAGERFETLRPGYAVVAAQVSAPRLDLPVRALRVLADHRTVGIELDPQAGHQTIGVTLGVPERGSGLPAGTLPQRHELDLELTPQGWEVAWDGSQAGAEGWSGWLPSADLAVARAFTTSSLPHQRLWDRLAQPGRLTLRSRVNLRDLLRPAVQPGSKLDATLPPEAVALRFEATAPFMVRFPERTLTLESTSDGGIHRVATTPGQLPAEPVLVEIVLSTPPGGSPPRLTLASFTAEDERSRAFPLERFALPWVRDDAEASPEPAASPLLAGGNWLRGKALFEGREARCAGCHTFRGQGGNIGPDLSNLEHRDPESVLRDIREPNAAINPDHLTYTLSLQDGRVLSGTVRSQGDQLLVGDREGKEVTVGRNEVEAMRPEPTSIMPEGLAQTLGPDRLRDLLTFLMTPDLAPAPVHRAEAPASRTRAEFQAVAGPAPEPVAGASAPRPLRLLLVGGPKDHGIDEHDYPLWQKRWSELFGRAEAVTVTKADGWPSDEALAAADLVVIHSANPGWSEAKAAALDAFLARGGGLALIHYAVNGQGAPEAFAKRIGLAWRGGHSKFRHGPLDLTFPVPTDPITRGFSSLKMEDESYWDLVGSPTDVQVLATQVEDGQPRPLIWTRTVGRGRVFVSIPGHYTWSFDDPLFRLLLLRGMSWAAGEPIDRFRDLALPGARVEAVRP